MVEEKITLQERSWIINLKNAGEFFQKKFFLIIVVFTVHIW
jgi:hypothetical protein